MKLTTALMTLPVLAALSFTAPAFGQMKGGEKLAGVRPPVNISTAPAGKMTCPTETRAVTDKSARGAFKSVSVYTAHLCPTCETREITKGAGKLATRTLEHTCKAATACCNGKG